MATDQRTRKELLAEIDDLRLRLEEAENVLHAIRSGEVDAIVVSGPEKDRVFTLKGAEHPYRMLVESMNEGAATLDRDSTIIYSNARLAQMLRLPLEKVIGSAFTGYVAPADASVFSALLEASAQECGKDELTLTTATGEGLPVQLSCCPVDVDGIPGISLVATDLSDQKRNEQLSTAERLARSILYQAGEAIIVCDPAGRVARASRVAVKLCGRNPLRRTFDRVLPLRLPGGDGFFSVSNLLRGAEPCENLEVSFDRSDGRTYHLILNATALTDRKGQVLGCVVTLTDFTERKQAEEDLRRGEERFRLIADMMPAFVWTTTAEGLIDYVNRQFLEFTGCSPEVPAEGYSFPVHPDDRAMTDEAYQKAIRAGKPYQIEHRLQRFDGVYRWYLCRSIPMREGGRIIKWYGTSTDVQELRDAQEELRLATEELEKRVAERTVELAGTVETLRQEVVERIAVEESLRESEALLKTVLDTLPVAVWVMDRKKDVVMVNPAGQRLWEGERYSSGQPQLYRGWRRDTGTPIENGEWGSARAIDRGEVTLGEVCDIVCFDGTKKTILYSAVPLKNKDEIVGAVVVNEDITKRIRSEQALKDEVAERLRAMEELGKKERLLLQQSRLAAMGEMIGNIAHQWRQPLNTLGLVIQELPLTYELGQFSKEYLNASAAKAMAMITHMSGTIDDFRNFFKQDKAKVVFRVNDVVEKTVSLMDASFKDLQAGIVVEARDELFIYGYPNEYSQVLLNILMNARDAFQERKTQQPTVVIRLFREDCAAVVTITDNAGGISPEIMDSIFDPYFTTKDPDKGTGIGLFMAKVIIETNMQGWLSARNTGDGAAFKIAVEEHRSSS